MFCLAPNFSLRLDSVKSSLLQVGTAFAKHIAYGVVEEALPPYMPPQHIFVFVGSDHAGAGEK